MSNDLAVHHGRLRRVIVDQEHDERHVVGHGSDVKTRSSVRIGGIDGRVEILAVPQQIFHGICTTLKRMCSQSVQEKPTWFVIHMPHGQSYGVWQGKIRRGLEAVVDPCGKVPKWGWGSVLDFDIFQEKYEPLDQFDPPWKQVWFNTSV